MNKLVLNFVGTTPPPASGYQISYRPKGSLQTYFSATSVTGSPILITGSILNNVDYEGFVTSSCGTSNSAPRSFKTSNYNNAIGNVLFTGCTAAVVSSIAFKSIAMFQLVGGNAYISNETGTGNLIINHNITTGTIKVTDSANAVFTQTITNTTNTFTGIVINATLPFKFEITCL